MKGKEEMFIKKKEKKDLSQSKETRKKTINLGVRKKTTIFFWILLIGSVTFGIYKNFTAVNTYTIEKTKIVEKFVIDTNMIESFIKNFAEVYYSWNNKKEGFIVIRAEVLRQYLTEELQELNVDTLRSDIPTCSDVKVVDIWKVEQLNEHNYSVLFSVKQLITEGKEKKHIQSAYTTTIHVDESNNMIITKNPTISTKPEKSTYEPKKSKDSTMDAEVIIEVTEFLTTFFELYPNASEKELSYYMKQTVLSPIEKDYIFVELVNPLYHKVGKKVRADITVKYLDKETKAVQISQYELTLEKQDNWMILN